MKNKKKILLGLLLAFGSIFNVCGQNSAAIRKLQMVGYAISRFYVDEVDDDKLVEAGIVGMLKQLDPHSSYSNAEEVKKLTEPLQGNFEGIGIQFQIISDTLMVIQPVSDGPCDKVGILPGDRIVTVNDTLIAGVDMKTDEIMRRLRGPKGSAVNLGVVRHGISEQLSFRVKRDRIPIHSLDASYMIHKGIGYIRINRFGATTADEFLQALTELQNEGMKDLILDLQGNGGGYLNAAIDLANQFLEAKQLIVYTQGRSDRPTEFFARGNGKFKKGRLVVLVDEYTASASEIVSGAVQDWDRGVIVGRRSYGKGLVQRPIDLPDGSMIRLTIARYYTPAGRCIQRPFKKALDNELADASKGAQGNMDAYNNDLMERYNRGEMSSADSIHFPDSLKCYTKLLKRTIYGGGGIMPDLFVPVDTTFFTGYYRKLMAKGCLLKTVAAYVDVHREELLQNYKSFAEFKKNFQITEEQLGALKKSADVAGVEFVEEEYKRSEPYFRMLMKAMIARDLWSITEYFQIINEEDLSVRKALDILVDGDYKEMLQNSKK